VKALELALAVVSGLVGVRMMVRGALKRDWDMFYSGVAIVLCDVVWVLRLG
jgi:hypothetical protein